MKVTKSKLQQLVAEELGLMNGNGSAYGMPGNWASKFQTDHAVEIEESPSGDEALKELGMFLAKLANEGQHELAMELDQILAKVRDAGLLADHPDSIQEGLDSAMWEAELVSENEYAICTDSIGKTAKSGTKRSEWTEAEKERYERCKKKVKEKES